MLAVHVLLSLLTALAFASLAVMLRRRPASAEVRPALDLFRLWWGALALRMGLDAAAAALLSRDALPVWLFVTMDEVELLAICVGLWALLCYLVYAYSGRRSAWGPLAVLYGCMALFLLGLVNWAGRPERLAIEHGSVVAIPGLELGAGTAALIVVLLVGPQVAAAAAYARLFPKAPTATQRYRIALVSLSLVVWLGTSLLANVFQAAGGAWAYASRGLGLGAALLVLVAYFPPRPVQRRLGVAALGREDPPAEAPPIVAAASGPRTS